MIQARDAVINSAGFALQLTATFLEKATNVTQRAAPTIVRSQRTFRKQLPELGSLQGTTRTLPQLQLVLCKPLSLLRQFLLVL